MEKTPRSMRLHIGIFGRTNVGKSSFLNLVAGQDVAITSPIAGTTTDVVEKVMELHGIGPVVFLDTAGVDDKSSLAEARLKKTNKIFDRADIAILLTEPGVWTSYEEAVLDDARKRSIPHIVVVNKVDAVELTSSFLDYVSGEVPEGRVMLCSSLNLSKRDEYVTILKKNIIDLCPESYLKDQPLLSDILPAGGIAVMIIPIDKEAPKGRIILPQVQAIRDALDSNATALVVKEDAYAASLNKLSVKPDLAICDSQVVDKMVRETPRDVKCTTFSILFSRYKGDLVEMVRGAAAIKKLKPGDRILIAEACSHHAIEDDIGRVKLPRWLKEYVKGELKIDTCAGRDFPENLAEYKLVIHCGACMFTRREMLRRIDKARQAGVPITNYGVAISFLRGILDRTLSPFPGALAEHRKL